MLIIPSPFLCCCVFGGWSHWFSHNHIYNIPNNHHRVYLPCPTNKRILLFVEQWQVCHAVHAITADSNSTVSLSVLQSVVGSGSSCCRCCGCSGRSLPVFFLIMVVSHQLSFEIVFKALPTLHDLAVLSLAMGLIVCCRLLTWPSSTIQLVY